MKEGQKLLLLYPSANRDEDVFADPFAFDAGRQPNEHVAFGFGTHYCLGNSLARLELRVMFEQLLSRVPDLALAGAITRDRIGSISRLPVTFTPRPSGT